MSFDIHLRTGILIPKEQFKSLITHSNYQSLIRTLESHECSGGLQTTNTLEETCKIFCYEVEGEYLEPLNEWLATCYPNIPSLEDIFEIDHDSSVWHGDMDAADLYPLNEYLFEFSLSQTVTENNNIEKYALTTHGSALKEALGLWDIEVLDYITMG